VKLFDGEIAQPRAEQSNHVFRVPDAGESRALFPRKPDRDFQGGEESRRLGGTDPRDPQQLGRRPGRQPAQRTVSSREQPSGKLRHRLATPAGAEQHGEQLRRGECGRTQAPQTLPRALLAD
jgi:hypothetical protein